MVLLVDEEGSKLFGICVCLFGGRIDHSGGSNRKRQIGRIQLTDNKTGTRTLLFWRIDPLLPTVYPPVDEKFSPQVPWNIMVALMQTWSRRCYVVEILICYNQ